MQKISEAIAEINRNLTQEPLIIFSSPLLFVSYQKILMAVWNPSIEL